MVQQIKLHMTLVKQRQDSRTQLMKMKLENIQAIGEFDMRSR